MKPAAMTITVHEREVVGEFRHLVVGGGPAAGHYLPALTHALLAGRPRTGVEVADATGPWSAGVQRCVLVRPGIPRAGAFVAVHWAVPRGDDLELGWHLLHLPGEAETQDPSTPAAALAWAWAEQVHDATVVPVVAQVAGPR